MPDFLSPSTLAVRDRAAELAAQLAPLRDDASLDRAARARRVREASKAAGIFALTQPLPDGTAHPALELVVARDTLSRANVGHLEGIFGPGPGVLANVSEPLRSSHLLPVLAGERRAGFAFTEPADAPAPTRARVDGDELVVNGQKSYVTGGADADFLQATLEIEGEGPAMVIIDIATEGVALTRRFGTLDGSHHAAFTFTDVRVPRSHVVGAAGEGMGRALGQIGNVRLAIAATCVGTCGWLVDVVGAHLQAPRRGGAAPLATSERARLRFGEMYAKAYVARAAVYRTARLADSGKNVVNESMAAKLCATETAGALVDLAIQLVGGEALTEGHALEAAYRRLRVLRLAEGESDTLRVNIARGLLDLGKGRV